MEDLVIQNTLRNKLNEITVNNLIYYKPILDKIGYIIPQFNNYVNSFTIPNNMRKPDNLGDYLQYRFALHILTDDAEKRTNIIELINSL